MAKVGEQLLQPELGWRRYDDRDIKMTYIGSGWASETNVAYYKSTRMTCLKSSINPSVRFTFYGTKFRWISSLYSDYSNNISIYIDNVLYDTNVSLRADGTGMTSKNIVLVYEKLNLNLGIHTVEIVKDTAGSYSVDFIHDAIDIDEDGYLITKVGNQLIEPEPGWRRYDDTYQGLIYSNNWSRNQGGGYASAYNGGYSYSTVIDSTMRFKFYGSKLRIIGSYNSNLSNDILITIDGIEYHFSEYATYMKFQILAFENLNLDKKIHEVVIKTLNTSYSIIDAIDIDEDGYIIARVGNQLLQPERDWKRCDLDDSNIILSGSWSKYTGNTNAYNGNYAWASGISSYKFKFYGSKFRIITRVEATYSDNVEVMINGSKVDTFSLKGISQWKTVVYEKINLPKQVHEVVISNTTSYNEYDCIDIDEDGYIIAQVGNQLIEPEPGWRRYDDVSIHKETIGKWLTWNNTNNYNGSSIYANTIDCSISFKFYGTKLRIIGGVGRCTVTNVVIDGVSYLCDTRKYAFAVMQNICFEIVGLTKKTHSISVVTAETYTSNSFIFDAVDIDEDGYIIAQVGSQLIEPEAGWRRYDIDNSNRYFLLNGTWNYTENEPNKGYNNTRAWGPAPNGYKFKFYGSKFRIICGRYDTRSSNIKVIIDSLPIESYSGVGNEQYQVLAYENLNLNKGIHTVEIRCEDKYSDFDAIDIDEDGHICEDNCQLYHGAKYLLKNNLTDELYTLSESNEVVTLATNEINAQQFINNLFNDITLLNKHISTLNSNYSILAYTEESTLIEATATFNHEPKSLLNENYDLLMLSDTDGTLKLNAIPQDQIVKGNGDIDLSGIKRLDKIELVSNNIKAALSFDSGATWNALVDGVWKNIDITNISEFNSKGMTNTLLAEVSGVKLEELRGESDKLRLAYLLSQEELNNPAYTDSLSLKVTLSGKDTIAANSEWSYALLDDLQTLEYTFNQNGTYTINYAY